MVVTDQDRLKVKEYLKECVKAKDRIVEEQAGLRDIVNTLKADHDIEPKIARKVIEAMRKGNAAEIKEAGEDLNDLLGIVG